MVKRRQVLGAAAAALLVTPLGKATSSAATTSEAAPRVRTTGQNRPAGVGVRQFQEDFMTLYNKIKDPANGYLSPDGIPYHTVETLLVEAPDHGHETTSESFSYLIWLEAVYGRVSGDWGPFNDSWTLMEQYIIPTAEDQPTNSFYDPSSPATYAPELDTPEEYPSPLNADVSVGQDPIASELSSTYGTDDIYAMHWLLDVDNVYGYGQRGDGTTAPSYINTFQRGSEESTWETVPHPSFETFTFGGPNGYLDLFTDDEQYAEQWRYTNAPDADARAVQAAYWALVWATEQGNQGQIADTLSKAAMMGDYLRYAFFDKYFKQVGDCVGETECAAGSGKNSAHYLLAWYFAWGGATDSNAGWAWRIGASHAHFGYQNPVAAWVLSTVPELQPQSATAVSDWETSLQRQVEFYRWLQSAEGAIAGGATNSWAGRYGDPPADAAGSTFYGMFFDWQPVYHDPPSSRWFGFQAWSMERVAEYFHLSGDQLAGEVLEKWVAWAMSETTINGGGDFQIPVDMSWTGTPDTWDPGNPGDNANLHVSVDNYTNDVGVTAAYVKTLTFYAAATGDTAAQQMAADLLDAMLANSDDLGIAVPETRADYSRFADPVHIPDGFSGTMPNGDPIENGATFTSIRTFYQDDPQWSVVQEALDSGQAPTLTYHRFWAQADIAIALAEYDRLFGTA